MSYTDSISDIENLPHYREYTCSQCGHKQRAYILWIQRECENCGVRSKLRGIASIGSEIEDVIDSVLIWLGSGADFELAMKWKAMIDSELERERLLQAAETDEQGGTDLRP